MAAITKPVPSAPAEPDRAPRPPLTPEAERALAEAAARRAARDAAAAEERRAREIQGRDGPEPVRYGDWEVKGIATDFS